MISPHPQSLCTLHERGYREHNDKSRLIFFIIIILFIYIIPNILLSNINNNISAARGGAVTATRWLWPSV